MYPLVMRVSAHVRAGITGPLPHTASVWHYGSWGTSRPLPQRDSPCFPSRDWVWAGLLAAPSWELVHGMPPGGPSFRGEGENSESRWRCPGTTRCGLLQSENWRQRTRTASIAEALSGRAAGSLSEARKPFQLDPGDLNVPVPECSVLQRRCSAGEAHAREKGRWSRSERRVTHGVLSAVVSVLFSEVFLEVFLCRLLLLPFQYMCCQSEHCFCLFKNYGFALAGLVQWLASARARFRSRAHTSVAGASPAWLWSGCVQETTSGCRCLSAFPCLFHSLKVSGKHL